MTNSSYRIGKEALFIKLFTKLDDKVLAKLLGHFGMNNGYEVKQTESGLKIVPSDSSALLYKTGRVKEFAQAALFCSYSTALDKDPNAIFDPNRRYAFVVDTSQLKFKFGKAMPFDYSILLGKSLGEGADESLKSITYDPKSKPYKSSRDAAGLLGLLRDYNTDDSSNRIKIKEEYSLENIIKQDNNSIYIIDKRPKNYF